MNKESENQESKRRYEMIYGGVGWPGKQPGFAIVLGMEKTHYVPLEKRHIFVVAEVESMNMRDLIHQCGVLDNEYQPQRWTGDTHNDAAERFIWEMNDEFKLPVNSANPNTHRRKFCLSPNYIIDVLEMEFPFPYIYGKLSEAVNPKQKQLFLDNSKVANYLQMIKPDETYTLQLGDYPAIEALGFALIEILQAAKYSHPVSTNKSSYDNNTLTRGLKLGRS